ncbi:hypothetical protein [Salidesulfovibrio onnuriiensis]|uniref:hypothetical protein n=1 Tax=Salidesulfovibrio onnuriiensis TaxID=2583823 RepID=UPI0011CADD68|nr:hypothetical protein [Salidesulfovibrio onnuriiensis]
MMRILLTALFLSTLLCGTAQPLSFEQAMKGLDPVSKYFIFIPGEEMEQGGTGPKTRYGTYEYDKIVTTLEKQGLTVISETRPRVSALQYAGSIVSKIRRMLGAGVPSVHITVGGFGKGGYIALLTASSLNDPYVSYVVMAGCGRGRNSGDYQQFLRRKRGHRLQGRILSLYDVSDLEAGSCKTAFEQAGSGIQSNEIQLRSGKGHGLFYTPNPQWLIPVSRWAQQ